MRSIGRDPIFVARADGPHVWDVDGNRYVDYLATWGPAILGHANPQILDAIRRQLPDGTSFGAPTEAEIRWGISGNLCRCTGYVKIVEAIQYAAAKMHSQATQEVSA